MSEKSTREQVRSVVKQVARQVVKEGPALALIDQIFEKAETRPGWREPYETRTGDHGGTLVTLDELSSEDT